MKRRATKRRTRLTAAQRQQLLRLYLEQGFHAAKPRAELLGVSARYLAKLARNHGHGDNYQRKGRYPRLERRRRDNTANDPRWQWAIARGPVSV